MLVSVVAVFIVMMMGARTGPVQRLSAARLTGMAATRLPVAHLDPHVAAEQPQLPAQRHRLPEVREDAREIRHMGSDYGGLRDYDKSLLDREGGSALDGSGPP
jgi:hypothetical protein